MYVIGCCNISQRTKTCTLLTLYRTGYTVSDLCELNFAAESVEMPYCAAISTPHTHWHQWDIEPQGQLVAYRLPRFKETSFGICARQPWKLSIDHAVRGILVNLSDDNMSGHYISVVRTQHGWYTYNDHRCYASTTISDDILRRVVLVICYSHVA